MQEVPFFAPLFPGEGTYCHLLHLLLTADSAWARAFRQSFSAEVLHPTLGLEIGDAPLSVRSEVTVQPPKQRSQTIDLVVDLEGDVIGIEVKVFATSARKGQLAAQYRGLRQQTPLERRVHILLIFPGPTGRHGEVQPVSDGDRAGSVSWHDVFECFPPTQGADPELLLGCLAEQAVACFATLARKAPKTQLTAERLAVEAEMATAAVLLSETLAKGKGALGGCSWRPHFWRDPKLDQYYGPIHGDDGRPRKGQYLLLSAHYNGPGEAHEIPVRVAFVLEWQGGAKSYRAEFKAALPDRMKMLPAPFGTRDVEREGTVVFDEFPLVVKEGRVTTASNIVARTALADILQHYAVAFADFLLRESRR